MKTRVLCTVLAVALLTALAASLAAAAGCNPIREIKVWGGGSSKPKTADSYQPDHALIGIGRYDMLDINRSAVGFSIAEREVVVYNRLVEILSNGPVQPAAVCVGKVRSVPTIFVGAYRLVSVYPQDARAAGMSQQELARKWAHQIAQALPLVAPTAAATKSGVIHCDRPCDTGQ
jgi:hypothetical protein